MICQKCEIDDTGNYTIQVNENQNHASVSTANANANGNNVGNSNNQNVPGASTSPVPNCPVPNITVPGGNTNVPPLQAPAANVIPNAVSPANMTTSVSHSTSPVPNTQHTNATTSGNGSDTNNFVSPNAFLEAGIFRKNRLNGHKSNPAKNYKGKNLFTANEELATQKTSLTSFTELMQMQMMQSTLAAEQCRIREEENQKKEELRYREEKAKEERKMNANEDFQQNMMQMFMMLMMSNKNVPVNYAFPNNGTYMNHEPPSCVTYSNSNKKRKATSTDLAIFQPSIIQLDTDNEEESNEDKKMKAKE